MTIPVPSALPRQLSRGALLLVLLLSGGCRAGDRDGAWAPPPPPEGSLPEAPQSPSADGVQLHRPVAAVPPLVAEDPVLQVALAAHLGPAGGADPAAAAPLRLRSAGGGLLTLVDGRGQRFMAPELTLHWRRQVLEQPLLMRRRVIGPFASFESAEEASSRWRRLGVNTRIAHPAEWEVWAPASAEPPQGLSARLWERRATDRLALELRRPEGAVALEGPLRIEAPAGLLWGSGVYRGPFRLLSDAYGTWSLVEEVPLERYLDGVVPHEIGAGAPTAALAAQAVLARTWAVRNSHRFAVDGYHLCADTQCQVYKDPRHASARVRQAIAASRHRVLAWQGRPIHAVYHASNGGVAAGFDEAWSGDPLPYLGAFTDGSPDFAARFPLPMGPPALSALLADGRSAYGADHPLFRWRRQLTAGEVARALGSGGVGQPQALRVLERGPSGRVLALEIEGPAGRRVLRLDAIRRTLRRLPSTLFTLEAAGSGVWQVVGGGFGHGAGLSQQGAIDLGRRGWTMDSILQRYYPGAELVLLGGLGGGPASPDPSLQKAP